MDRLAAISNGEKSNKKDFHVVYSNLHNYMVGKTCANLPNDTHEISYAVWMREKSPSMYMRNQVRTFLLWEGVDLDTLQKGNSVDCWGDDKFWPCN